MLGCSIIIVAKKIIIVGLTQGVGFRPFVYRIARKNNLGGYIRNRGGSEVEVHIEGRPRDVERFLKDLNELKPPPAEIEELIIVDVDPQGTRSFLILPSERGAEAFSQIPPDFSICDYCLEEIRNRDSRFYRYPFHSCAWCGPRFTIIERIPYDRNNTSMADFPLCKECRREYEDPDNLRRFHAQGISCAKCGPRLWLTDNGGEVVDTVNPLETAARLIDEGNIVAIKGIGGFHIAALATDDEVVLELRRRKKRPQKPFAIMAIDIDAASRIVRIDERAKNLLLSPSRPIVLLPEREDTPVSRNVAPGLTEQGVMLAYSGIHYLLLEATRDRFLIMTSGNRKGKPIAKTNSDALKQLSDMVDYFVFHNRRIINRVDDSVVRFTNGRPVFLRRSRGYVPRWLRINIEAQKPVVAFGAELQNAGAVAFSDKIILTQYTGDMDELENLLFLEEALNFLIRAYGIDLNECIFVADMHPRCKSRFLAEEWAKRFSSEVIYVQHHKAHIASVLAENRIDPEEKIVGIAIDGVGYGEDGYIWGGEVFYGKLTNLRRVGHIAYSPMPGGDLATRYPLRMLLGILSIFLSDGEIEEIFVERGLIHRFRTPREFEIALRQARLESTKTSSIGRVLDAVSGLLGVCYERTYEGEPAIKLEAFSRRGKIIDGIDVAIRRNGDVWILDTAKFFESMLNNSSRPEDIAKTAQYALGWGLGRIAAKYLSNTEIQAVFVSGGAAVNDYIIQGIYEGAGKAGIVVNTWAPPGDGGIALGQTYLAIARWYQ